MRTLALPIAQPEYSRQEEQVFRDHVRRGIRDSATTESLYLLSQRISNLPTFADNAAAGVGGLATGEFYKTATGQVMVKL